MLLPFTKMHGAGNDFVVLNGLHGELQLTTEQVRWLGDRHFGVGCDQVLIAAPPTEPGMDVRYIIYNSDGHEVEQCGNGVRCLARFLVEQGLTERRQLRIQTLGGPTEAQLLEDGRVAVNMGRPHLEPDAIPFRAERQAATYSLMVDGKTLTISAVSMGNPHAVLVMDSVDRAPLDTLGPRIEHHPDFPNGANAGFMECLGPERIRLRVHERGAGETLACGTGACAAVVAGRLQGRLQERVTVALPGGELEIEWAGELAPVWMTGPAVTVFRGEAELPPPTDSPCQ